MSILGAIQHSINRIGIKEVARRTGLASSTVSRIHSGKIKPSLEVAEKILRAAGFQLELHQDKVKKNAPRFLFAKDILRRLRNELKALGVRHVTIFGSTARGDDKADSDIDIYMEFVDTKPSVAKLLKAEGRILESFGENKVDIVSDLNSFSGKRLKLQIDKDGKRVF